MSEPGRGCPCLYTTPCHKHCTCANPGMSHGCNRCCSFGSLEQRTAKAVHLAALLDAAHTPKKKTATIVLDTKEPDGWHELLTELGYYSVDEEGNDISTPEVKEKLERHFKYGEYATLEVEIDEDFHIVGGQVCEC